MLNQSREDTPARAFRTAWRKISEVEAGYLTTSHHPDAG
jgi:hypothetical protein